MRFFVLAFVLGTCWLQQQPVLPEASVAWLGVAAWLAAAMVPERARQWRVIAYAAAGLCVGIGLASWRAQVRLADALPPEWEGRDIAVVGVVASLPQVNERGTRFAFDVQSVETPGAVVPQRISLMSYVSRGDAAPSLPVVAGQRWRATVRLKRPRGLANRHGFDFEPWALERGLRATGYLRSKPAPVLLEARVEGWPYTLHRWRGEIRESMASHLGEDRFRGVLIALAIGDQDAIAADDWQVFWRTGVGHLMSISGLHITMLAGLAAALAYFAWVRVPWLALRWPAIKVAALVGALAALAYALLTGFAVPAQRTVLMLTALAACVLADRHGSPSRVLAIAALSVVGTDPWAVLASGFWLSFGAVAGIFYCVSLRTGALGKVRAAAMEQLAVTVVMAPMLLALFQEVSLVSPLANAIAIPLVSLVVVPLTLAGAFLGLDSLLDAAHQLMAWLMVPLEWLAELPGGVFESHEPAAWTVACALVGCAWLLAPRGFPLRPFALVWIAPVMVILPPHPAPGEAWIDVLDVGQGLAVVVRTASRSLVYDTGPAWNSESDSGNRIVVPFLRGEGLRHIDGLVVSHADDDHSGGAQSVAALRSPEWLLSPLAADDPLHEMVDVSRMCRVGQRWTWDGVTFEVMHPADSSYDEPRRKENDRSCVVRVASGGASMLLTGDVEARSEAELLTRGTSALRSDVLLVPHHGSRTSSTERFLDAVAPSIAVVSLGYRNRFGHPNEAVAQRYVQRRLRLRRTDLEGAIRIVLPAGDAARVESIAPEPRYWSDRTRVPR
ncbi:ComE operon protein 3 [Usitatibacter rugosus]|uniref:ComE operon protein 3 n=1 Tax=Usitatibacter rugosus TaxID=2732067 RepID=A0A6M4GWU1_9PROT|nr:DNA internalization-related competence protein ComEC/Rec2 [Usitatibacter rugosus]QJR11475.1 ComE operon protein 3 [Usitatibacter rugosus]